MAGKPWSTREIMVLEKYAAAGVCGVQRKLKAECGTKRTKSAIKHQASALRVSLVKHAVCPRCGRVVKKLVPVKGLCLICAAYEPTANQKRAEVMRRMEPSEEDRQALREARRYQDRQRQHRHRAKKADGTSCGTSQAGAREILESRE